MEISKEKPGVSLISAGVSHGGALSSETRTARYLQDGKFPAPPSSEAVLLFSGEEKKMSMNVYIRKDEKKRTLETF